MCSKNRRSYWLGYSLIFVGLQLLDGILTCVGVHLYGLDLEANPLAAHTFSKLGIYQSAIAWKVLSLTLFFSLLWYSLNISWSTLDIIGLSWGRKPKADKSYAMMCFDVFAIAAILVSLYAGGGWIYILIFLGFM